MPLNERNHRLKKPVVKGRYACDAQLHTLHIGVFKSDANEYTPYIYNESANIIEGCNVTLTPVIASISHKRCQWLALRVWWLAPAFGIHEVTWHRAYVA